MRAVPDIRIRALNSREVDRDGDWVLYWMAAYRRPLANFSLQRAVEWALLLGKPLVLLEALRIGDAWASDRSHRFILDGMCDNEEALRESNALYYPFVERRRGECKGFVEALAARACVIVSDDWPSSYVPRMLEAAARRVPIRTEVVDSNGLLPMRATARVFPSANSFRLYLRKTLPQFLDDLPAPDPLRGVSLEPMRRLPPEVQRRWPRASRALLDGDPCALQALPIDHSVRPVEMRGGHMAGLERMRAFVRSGLEKYEECRSSPEIDGTSKLSPYLHFGHVGTTQVFELLMRRGGERRRAPGLVGRGRKQGLFGLSSSAEKFLDELITWRELAFNMISKRADADQYSSLPEWARRTLDEHRADPRPRLQTRAALERGDTPDPVFNAAQCQLVTEGWLHNSLRMIWGKKILEYSASPEAALETMKELMNRYSLDGQDPSSISGIFWVLGRYDRPWGPERPIFGKVRYLSSDTREKLRKLARYIERYARPAVTPTSNAAAQ